ncbi:hypothetical protein [Acetobacter orientalis]|uniref:Uncharacterized protein n=1 Tax=Acetobacter orientalis TaxID=146474 RepID=A0A0D6NNB0_9PROT|nr:hypothetical protein [Acetobacter orientalis]GAN66891.1 hypothetical protein Abor_031_057 [Acetobacter orientalis]GBR14323.1 hypothetical protein AA0481_0582 [Acetobacter orientalis NRIC 0481]GEL60864.1 hypothetical protein AOR02nite_07060 [Acetobacter orientalis]
MTPTDCRHASNVEIYAKPRNWEVACAITQMKAWVVLTEGQEAMLEQVRKEA